MSDNDAAASEDATSPIIGSRDFLGTTTDNRISVINDPNRWEGLASDEEEEDLEENDSAGRTHLQQAQLPDSSAGPSTVGASADAENEDYRMFLTHRSKSQQRQQQQQPPNKLDEEEDEQERYVEHLGYRLVPEDQAATAAAAAGRGATEDENSHDSDTPRPEQQQQQHRQVVGEATEGRHFSVRSGGNQLADLLPPNAVAARRQQQPQTQPQTQPQQFQPPEATVSPHRASTADAAEAGMPSVPKERYVGYLRLDSGHVVGPFRWNVDSVETPVSLEEGLSSRQPRQSGLFSALIDARSGSSGQQQRVITRSGRLAFLDPAAGNREISGQPVEIRRSLEALSEGLAALAAHGRSEVRDSGQRPPQADDAAQLTRLLADALAANGASLMVACANAPAERDAAQPASSSSKRPAKEAATQAQTTAFADASVTARGPDERRETTPRQQQQQQQQQQQKELELLVQSLRRQVDSLRTQNGSLKEQLKEAETSSAAASAALPGSPDKHRPVSKGSYQSLYEMLQEYMQENETLRNENLDLVKFQGEHRKEQDQLARENRRLASRLNRVQRQAAAQQSSKPIYVVSNPESRASSNQQRAKQQQPQQQQQVASAGMSVTSSATADNESTSLPPIPADRGADAAAGAAASRRPAFPTPPSVGSSQRPGVLSPTQRLLRQQQQQLAQLQMQLQLQQQQMQQASYYQHVPVGPSYSSQMPQQQQQQQQQQRQHHHQQQPADAEKPLHVPKPGEKTYRGRFQQQNAVVRDPHRHPEVNAHAVQDANKMNESLKGELRQLDGAIQQHQRVNALQSNIRRNEGRKVLRTF